MVFPVKIMTFDCVLFFIVCSTLVSEIFANSNCEKNVLKVFPKGKTPKQCFVYAFKNLSYKYFDDHCNEINHDAEGYFKALLEGCKSCEIEENETNMKASNYCKKNYEENRNPCIIALWYYLNCNETPPIKAIEILYEMNIYKDLENLYLSRYNRPQPPKNDEKRNKKYIKILQKYFKYIQKIAESTRDENFPTIQQYCESQASSNRSKKDREEIESKKAQIRKDKNETEISKKYNLKEFDDDISDYI